MKALRAGAMLMFMSFSHHFPIFHPFFLFSVHLPLFYDILNFYFTKFNI